MKIQKFLEHLQHLILFETNINLKTFKLILYYFKECLSDPEIKRWNTTINILEKYDTKQQSIITAIKKMNQKFKPKEVKE